jgi:hypothetical protein
MASPCPKKEKKLEKDEKEIITDSQTFLTYARFPGE